MGKTFEIYKITNKINGKCYIGQTQIGHKNRFKKHLRDWRYRKVSILGNAIKKYGGLNFSCEKIDTAESLESLNVLEIKYIKELNTLSPNGYNLKEGGEDGAIHKHRFQKDMSKTGYVGVHPRGKNFMLKFIKTENNIKLEPIRQARRLHMLMIINRLNYSEKMRV